MRAACRPLLAALLTSQQARQQQQQCGGGAWERLGSHARPECNRINRFCCSCMRLGGCAECGAPKQVALAGLARLATAVLCGALAGPQKHSLNRWIFWRRNGRWGQRRGAWPFFEATGVKTRLTRSQDARNHSIPVFPETATVLQPPAAGRAVAPGRLAAAHQHCKAPHALPQPCMNESIQQLSGICTAACMQQARRHTLGTRDKEQLQHHGAQGLASILPGATFARRVHCTDAAPRCV